MSRQIWVGCDVAQSVAGASFGLFTTAKTIIPATSRKTYPSNYFENGRSLEIDVLGGIGALITTPGTMTFQVMLGAAIVYTTGAIQLNASGHVNIPFHLKIWLTCRAIGNAASANFMGVGEISGKMFTNTAGQVNGLNTDTTLMVPATAMTVGAGFDSTIDNVLDFFGACSISDAANTMKIEQYFVKPLN